MNGDLAQRLERTNRQPGHITPGKMDTQVNSQGQRSEIGSYRLDTAHYLRQGRDNALKVAVPAYEGKTSDGTADNTETFTLSHDVTDTPVTQSVVVWLDGTYYGTPDSVDYTNNTIDVTDPGTGSNVHIYYVAADAASLEIRKVDPGESTSQSQRVYSGNLGLVHQSPQLEQPEYMTLNDGEMHPWVAADQQLVAYVDAPYTIRWTDPDGDGTEPTNALLHVPVLRGSREVPGLRSAIIAGMGR
ncbi:hypothetical protein EGH21_05435 [Halomicroarcula sp. F13]|uniref:Uncharacterized protein n=1 Tax=Haloarcula rubra TaxID=2487747 RepID=A0AAW4PQI3_9EURY|nr:hypothetical protein [Halomicroarcula rubra]MBX0322469.1 hypothetical protein [Halomicroarcula rubra]